MSKKRPTKEELTEARTGDTWIDPSGKHLPFRIMKKKKDRVEVVNAVFNKLVPRDDIARPIVGVYRRLKNPEVTEMERQLAKGTPLEEVIAWGVMMSKKKWNRIWKDYRDEQIALRKAAQEAKDREMARAASRYPVTTAGAPIKTGTSSCTVGGTKQTRKEIVARMQDISVEMQTLIARLAELEQVGGIEVAAPKTAFPPAPPPLPLLTQPVVAKEPPYVGKVGNQASDNYPSPSVMQPRMKAVLESN